MTSACSVACPVFYVFEVRACAAPPISTTVEVATHWLSVVWKVHSYRCQPRRWKGPAVQSHPYYCRFGQPPVQVGWCRKCGRGGGARGHSGCTQSVGERMSHTCDYTNLPNLLRLQSPKLAYCKCVCVWVRVCMCQCVSVGKTPSGVYACVFMCVRRVFWCVLGRASSYVCLCACINECVYLCRPVMLCKEWSTLR